MTENTKNAHIPRLIPINHDHRGYIAKSSSMVTTAINAGSGEKSLKAYAPIFGKRLAFRVTVGDCGCLLVLDEIAEEVKDDLSHLVLHDLAPEEDVRFEHHRIDLEIEIPNRRQRREHIEDLIIETTTDITEFREEDGTPTQEDGSAGASQNGAEGIEESWDGILQEDWQTGSPSSSRHHRIRFFPETICATTKRSDDQLYQVNSMSLSGATRTLVGDKIRAPGVVRIH
ncbi:hypothetical protein BJ878DRAFT_481384 [Calycina marina]|uniref:Uncharacterized protein n=1 Tax=Calycina marina TaxID=1763456 RepID=A0A9P7Z0K2_9HELO|nr:hypothetical protein BJ878DRAFT_481384 [Calycina marina]